jgi:hypothetical protein
MIGSIQEIVEENGEGHILERLQLALTADCATSFALSNLTTQESYQTILSAVLTMSVKIKSCYINAFIGDTQKLESEANDVEEICNDFKTIVENLKSLAEKKKEAKKNADIH